MSDLGRKVQLEIEAKLQGFIEAEELSAMIDASIPKIRESLEAKVRANVQQLAEKRLDPFLNTYGDSEAFEAHAAKIADALVQQTVTCYLEDAADIAAGKDPRHGLDPQAGNRHHAGKSKVSKLAEIVEKKIVTRLAEKIDRLIDKLLDEPKLDQKAEGVLANMLPKAAAAFMESAGIRMVRSFNDSIRHGREVSVHLHTAALGNCPSCSTQIKSCTKCGTLRRCGETCCGEYINF